MFGASKATLIGHQAAGGLSPPQSSNLQVWYDFAGDVATNKGVLGASNDGTLAGTPTFEDSIYGRAIVLNIATDTQYVSIPAFGTSQATYSVAVMFKTTVTDPGSIVRATADQTVMMSSWTSAGGTSGKAVASYTSGATFQAESTETITDGSWHLAIGTYGGDAETSINIDGGSEVLSSATSNTAHDNPWRLGMFQTTGIEEFKGRIAQPMIWNVRLSASERTDLATQLGF